MEFSKNLQTLRKQHNLTQEELAAALYVSRAAVSKWESGRGYPSLDSLKTIASLFGVTVDALLSGDTLLTLAEEDLRNQQAHDHDLLFGFLDLSAVLFLFFPLFREHTQAVSLLSMAGLTPWLKIACLVFVTASAILGVATLSLQNCHLPLWVQHKRACSLILHAVGLLLFIALLQPYAASLSFVFLAAKAILLIRRR